MQFKRFDGELDTLASLAKGSQFICGAAESPHSADYQQWRDRQFTGKPKVDIAGMAAGTECTRCGDRSGRDALATEHQVQRLAERHRGDQRGAERQQSNDMGEAWMLRVIPIKEYRPIQIGS